MHRQPIKSLLACLLGAAFLAGCASPSSSTQASASAAGIQKGRVVAVEPIAAAGSSMSAPAGASSSATSGASMTGASAAGSPSAVVTVQYANGEQSRYAVTQNKTTFKVGDPVGVIMNGDQSVMMRQ